MIVDLTEQEWQAVIQCMAYAPARESVPYMNKISAQVTPQLATNAPPNFPKRNSSQDMPATIPTNLPDDIPLKRNN